MQFFGNSSFSFDYHQDGSVSKCFPLFSLWNKMWRIISTYYESFECEPHLTFPLLRLSCFHSTMRYLTSLKRERQQRRLAPSHGVFPWRDRLLAFSLWPPLPDTLKGTHHWGRPTMRPFMALAGSSVWKELEDGSVAHLSVAHGDGFYTHLDQS